MALMSDEPSETPTLMPTSATAAAAAGSNANASAPEVGAAAGAAAAGAAAGAVAERRPSVSNKEKRQKSHRQASSCDGEIGVQSETSSNTEKSTSPRSSAPAPPSAPAPIVPTKRTIRDLLEKRDTPRKMEIGQGVLLAADISGAELVIIRGNFEGNIKAQCIDIEQGAEVRGKIECDGARINGKFDGVFMSSHSLQLASHADVSGRIIYRRLKVAKGAQLYGHSEYRSPVAN